MLITYVISGNSESSERYPFVFYDICFQQTILNFKESVLFGYGQLTETYGVGGGEGLETKLLEITV